MSNRTDVFNDKNMPIGFMLEYNECINGMHLKKGYVGRYQKSSNITFDKNGKIFCFGNGLDALIRKIDGK